MKRLYIKGESMFPCPSSEYYNSTKKRYLSSPIFQIRFITRAAHSGWLVVPIAKPFAPISIVVFTFTF